MYSTHRSPLGKLQMQLINAIQYPLGLLHNSDRPIHVRHTITVQIKTHVIHRKP